MVERKAVHLKYLYEEDRGKEDASAKLSGGIATLLLEQTTIDYFNIVAYDNVPKSSATPRKAAGILTEVSAYDALDTYQKSPTAAPDATERKVGKKVRGTRGRNAEGRRRGKRVIITTGEKYETKRRRGDEQVDVTAYRKKSFTFPYFFDHLMIRQALGIIIKAKFPWEFMIQSSVYPFLEFPSAGGLFTDPQSNLKALSGAWPIDDTDFGKEDSEIFTEIADKTRIAPRIRIRA